MDVLSDVLQLIRLNGAALFRTTFTAPWAIVSSGPDGVLRRFPSSVHRVIVFHVITQGSCWLQCPGAAPQRLAAGDAIVLPRCDVHVLADDPERTPVPTERLLGEVPVSELRDISWGGGGRRTRILCGFLSCEQSDLGPLFAALPALFRVSFRDEDGSHTTAGLLNYAVRTITSADNGVSISRLRVVELLFVEALRRHIAALPREETGWLAGLRDPLIGRALGLLHADPCRAWTVAELAVQAAASRSALATRFRAVLGEAPMHYLARWRLLLAVRQLRDTHRSVARIAEAVGYDSPAAFQRAFKRLHGETPAACRKRLQVSPPAK